MVLHCRYSLLPPSQYALNQQLVNKYWEFTHINKIIPYYVIEENCEYIKNKLTSQELKMSPEFLQFNTDVNETFGKLTKKRVFTPYSK